MIHPYLRIEKKEYKFLMNELIEFMNRLCRNDLVFSRDAEISVILSDNKTLQDLNLTFLNIDEPTDVLAFPGNEIDPETGLHYMGDIIISVEKAASQAANGGHEAVSEIKLLIIHGLLHLLGYDHQTDDEKVEMWKVQRQLLVEFQILLDESYP